MAQVLVWNPVCSSSIQSRGNQPIENILPSHSGIFGRNSSLVSGCGQFLGKTESFAKRKRGKWGRTYPVIFSHLVLCRSLPPCMYLIKTPQTYEAPRESSYISAVLSRTEERASPSTTEEMLRLTQNLHHWNLDSEVPAPEHKSLAAGRIVQQNYLEIPVDQLMLEPNLSVHTQKSIQNSRQGVFQLWNCPLDEGSTIENREFKKSSMETGFNVTNNRIRVFTPNHSLTSASVDKQVGPYPGLPGPLGVCWSYADGDFFKNRNEIHISSCSTIGNNDGETLPAPNWNLKHGNSSVEENLTDESDLSENEKANDTLLSYFEKMDLNLKPETIENVEEPFTEEPNEVFPYPDFLPPPFSTLDLHNLALSKSENWKATVEPAESSLEHLITRLLELERLQHMTIQKERPRLQTTLCTPAVTERPFSSKVTPKVRQPKPCDSLSLQIPCVAKSQEKRKNNSGSCKLEQNSLKWNWSNAGKHRWHSRPSSLKSSSTTKQLIATYDDKNPKSSILNPCQELSSKPTAGQTTQSPTAGQTTQSLVKRVSTRRLPSRSPMPVSPILLSFPENQKEIKAPKRNFGTKKKLYRQNIVLNRPFYIQKLNCWSPSFIAKDQCSPTDQK
uniref:protein FAM217A isoform X2 n=1 Tax=Callithrix jacchus TaxID=9483 RepID=UPI0023DD4513|nr:protein FAM217A isoform X2 [Callithrix jacchus]